MCVWVLLCIHSHNVTLQMCLSFFKPKAHAPNPDILLDVFLYHSILCSQFFNINLEKDSVNESCPSDFGE